MSTQRTIRRTLLAMAVAALGLSGTAMAEPWVNDTIDDPQLLQFDTTGMAQWSGRIDNSFGADVDYYSFVVSEGDVVVVDVDGGMPDGLDSVLYVFDPSGTRRLGGDAVTKDTDPADSGSLFTKTATATFDSFVTFTVPQGMGGAWKVAVVAEPAVINDNGILGSEFPATGGTYTLFVSRTPGTPAPEQPKPKKLKVKIDIKPGDPHDPTPINKAKGHIRVALMSSTQPGTEFDPFAIEVGSLRFGRTGDERSLIRCAKRGKDLNGDGKRDRVCRFDAWKTRFTRSDTLGIMNGTFGRDSYEFEGAGNVKVLSQKHRRGHWHHDDDDDD
jgi:hypothetical protein